MYDVRLSSKAEASLKSQDGSVRKKFAVQLDALTQTPNTIGKSLSNELAGYKSVRVLGRRYRIVFRVTSDPRGKAGAGSFVPGVVEVPYLGPREDGSHDDVYNITRQIVSES